MVVDPWRLPTPRHCSGRRIISVAVVAGVTAGSYRITEVDALPLGEVSLADAGVLVNRIGRRRIARRLRSDQLLSVASTVLNRYHLSRC